MGCYHFNMKQVCRSKGESAIAAAAYQSGECLYDEYYGEKQDYSRKKGVVRSEIHLPEIAPMRLQDRQTLWNEVEQIEKNKKAQLAHRFNMALMNEFSMEENIELARRFVDEQFVSRGMIADLAIHNPEGDSPNPHIHVMIPIRPLQADGTWGNKQKKIPVVDSEGNQVLNENGKPKMRAVHLTNWSSKETLLALRKSWADINNELYEKKGFSERIDWRSFEDRGLERIPTIHEGADVRAMEKRGIITEIGTINRMIRAMNEHLEYLMEVREWIKNKILQIRKAIRSQPEPTLANYLQSYYDRRNKAAEQFAYGTQKAQIHNFQHFVEAVNFLLREKIYTETDLQEQIAEISAEILDMKKQLSAKSKELNNIQKLLRDSDAYPKLKAVKQEYDKKWFGKDKFKKEHERELKRYYAVEKELTPFFSKDGRLPEKQWQQQTIKVQTETNKMQEELDHLFTKLKMLKKVKWCIEQVMEPEDESAVRPNVNSAEKMETKISETKHESIHSRLKSNREKIQKENQKKMQHSTEHRKDPEL